MTRFVRRAAACAMVVAIAASGISSGCGPRPTSGRQQAETSLRTLFPDAENRLARAAVLDILPWETLAVVLTPGLETLHRQVYADAQLPADVRAGLGQLIQERVGYDLLDLERMRALGVDTRAPVALALLDLETATVVLPLRDRASFTRGWREASDTLVVTQPGHALVAFPLAMVFDPTKDIVRSLRIVAKEASLGQLAGVRAAGARLRFGGDLVALCNTPALRVAVARHLQSERHYIDLDAARDMVSLAEYQEDRTELEAAQVALSVLQRQAIHLDTWAVLLDNALGALDGAAFGVALGDDAFKVRGALALADGVENTNLVAPLPPGIASLPHRGVRLATRLPAKSVLPALDLLLERRVTRKTEDLIAALGGYSVLDGVIDVAVDPGRARISSTSNQPPAMLVRVGLRDPGRTQAVLGSQRKIPGWKLSVEGRFLTLSRRMNPRNRRVRPGRSSPLARVLLQRFEGAGVLDLEAANVLPYWLRPATDRPTGESPDGPPNALEKRRRLVDQRAYWRAQIDRRLGALSGPLARALGFGVASLERRGRTLYVHGIQEFRSPTPGLLGLLAQLWYERSNYSTNGGALARVERELVNLETHMLMEDLPELIEPVPSAASARVSSGLGSPPGLPPLPPPSGLPPPPPPPGLPLLELQVTASVTSWSAGLDRAALDRALLRTLPRLRWCHQSYATVDRPASHYATASLEFEGGVVQVVGLTGLDHPSLVAPELASCIRKALDGLTLADKRTGSAEATLWVGTR